MDVLDWARGILQTSLADWLKWGLIALGAILIAWAKSKNWRWVTPTLYGLVAAAALYVLLSGLLSGTATLSERSLNDPVILETTVKSWIEAFYLGVKKDPDPKFFFRFIVEQRPGNTLAVGQMKEYHKDFLLLHTRIVLNTKQSEAVAKLPENKQKLLISRIKMDALSFGMLSYVVKEPLKNIQLESRVPIVQMNKVSFITEIGHFDRCTLMISERIGAFLLEHEPNEKKSETPKEVKPERGSSKKPG